MKLLLRQRRHILEIGIILCGTLVGGSRREQRGYIAHVEKMADLVLVDDVKDAYLYVFRAIALLFISISRGDLEEQALVLIKFPRCLLLFFVLVPLQHLNNVDRSW